MLEERLAASERALTIARKRSAANTAGITQSVGLYDLLGTRPLSTPDASGKGPSLKAFSQDPGLPWETRLENLLRIAGARKNLWETTIPHLTKEAPKLDKEVADRERDRQNALAQIHATLLLNRRQVIDNVRAGWLRRDDVVWVDSLISGYGFPEPQPEALPTPNLDAFLRPKNKQSYRDFLKTPQFGHLLVCLSECLDQEGQVSAEMISGILGYIYEQKVAPIARPRLSTSLKTRAPFVVISPEDTFELFRMANEKRVVDKFAYGLQAGIDGISVPDAVIIFPKGTEAHVRGVAEFTMAHVEGNERKEKQIKFYEKRRNGMADLTAEVFEYHNAHRSDSPLHPLAKYPDLAGRKFVVPDFDDGFTCWYFVPEKGHEMPGVDPGHVIPVNLNPNELINFARALAVDYSREYLAFGDLLNTTSPEAFRKLLVH